MINLDYFLRELTIMKKSFWLVSLALIFGFNAPVFAAHDGRVSKEELNACKGKKGKSGHKKTAKPA